MHDIAREEDERLQAIGKTWNGCTEAQKPSNEGPILSSWGRAHSWLERMQMILTQAAWAPDAVHRAYQW